VGTGLTVQFLGSGDAFGSGGRLQACILLRSEGGELLLDCGASSLIAMKRAGVDPSSIGYVALSHLHGDHFGGVPFLVLDGQFSRRERPLVVAGPRGVEQRVLAAMEVLFPGSSSVARRFPVEFVEFDPARPTRLGAAEIAAYEVDHASGAPALALRVAMGGRVVAYSGDTAWTPTLVEAARGSDLFICEAYFAEKRVPFHLDLATLRTHLGEIGCRRVVLTHMGPDVLALDEPGLERVHDGLVVEV
jgi:ribonuclease BN (tRNA processing enzyme)